MRAILLTVLLLPAPVCEQLTATQYQAQSAGRVNWSDRAAVHSLVEELRRQQEIRRRNTKLPVCPIQPNYYRNLDCA